MDDRTRKLVNNIDPVVWARIESLSDWHLRLGALDRDQVQQLLLHVKAACKELEEQDA